MTQIRAIVVMGISAALPAANAPRDGIVTASRDGLGALR